jgi:hypothetical protein
LEKFAILFIRPIHNFCVVGTANECVPTTSTFTQKGCQFQEQSYGTPGIQTIAAVFQVEKLNRSHKATVKCT